MYVSYISINIINIINTGLEFKCIYKIKICVKQFQIGM